MTEQEQEDRLRRIEIVLSSLSAKIDRLLVKKHKGPQTRETLIAEAKENGAYQGLDLEREWGKMVMKFPGKVITRARWVNWLNIAVDRGQAAVRDPSGPVTEPKPLPKTPGPYVAPVKRVDLSDIKTFNQRLREQKPVPVHQLGD